MTQREFERRVKGIERQPRKWFRREPAQPRRFKLPLRAAVAVAFVAVVLGVTASRTRDFSFRRAAVAQPAQVTGHVLVAQAIGVSAPRATGAHKISDQAHLRHAANRARHSLLHSGAAGAPHNSSAAPAGGRGKGAMVSAGAGLVAAVATSDGTDSSLGGTVMWIQSRIRSSFAPVFGSDAADSAAESFAVNFPFVAAGGAFILVMLVCLGAGKALLPKPQRAQRAEV